MGFDRRWSLALIIGIVLFIRLPFLNQAVQGDDPKFIWIAQHALIDPAHPNHTQYIFQGEPVDMRGHPHPPGNSWVLAGLITLVGDVLEVPFHAVYLLFSLLAAVSMFALAKRFSPDDPLSPTLLFLAVPAFVINGNSFESDVPFLAWWMLGFALFTWGRPLVAVLAFALAAMTSYQSIVATPILLAYTWLCARDNKCAWVAAFAPAVVVVAYQAWERITGGAMPATVLAGYFSTYGLQQLSKKLQNLAALTAHLAWMVFPIAAFLAVRHPWRMAALAGVFIGALIDPNPLFSISFAIGLAIIAGQLGGLISKPKPAPAVEAAPVGGWLGLMTTNSATGERTPETLFLHLWFVIFFVSALVLFFAGSARYLLPLAAPLALLTARALPQRLILPAVGLNLALGLALAWVNYEHWDGYRTLTASVAREVGQKRVWLNGEWATFYMEAEGALPLTRKQIVQSGEWIVSSALGYPIQITAPLGLVTEREIRPTLPLRLIGLGSKSGYSTASLGFRPFDVTFGALDKVRIEAVLDRKPTLSWFSMGAPESATQIVSGMYQAENGARWMSGRATILLKEPAEPKPLAVDLFLHDTAPGRTFTLSLDGNEILRRTLTTTGAHTLITPPAKGQTLVITVDKTFSVAGDFRELGAVILSAGFR
jgi:hypothetical protein